MDRTLVLETTQKMTEVLLEGWVGLAYNLGKIILDIRDRSGLRVHLRAGELSPGYHDAAKSADGICGVNYRRGPKRNAKSVIPICHRPGEVPSGFVFKQNIPIRGGDEKWVWMFIWISA